MNVNIILHQCQALFYRNTNTIVHEYQAVFYTNASIILGGSGYTKARHNMGKSNQRETGMMKMDIME